ncbi:MAG: alpha/beta hydrolase [Phenylobacterium sp.]|uniref:alpha/beta fold hydrolase n=1 Tax=Phenylobacterium sp. TaxID=1871053 RepID=UPI0027194018|nr:alpha/beta hydrolase [Phenylobacterium sp.]MDO8322445.1 alpha/beta hydrolase [Phenylobacterium sp.]MDO8910684.1 alpha/beta hydrolase [Phenylobacterium sp.]MDO9246890.1 alpha/beta hydrolase [Phenylobacterium sp.]MDP2011361.1 alpha/beta hydrolase [Phenylobacterium sp.]MDP3102583.1 alpha/beta hydrolase [Phenylobacterium sp.]
MPQIIANGIPLEYAVYGPEKGEAVLLIMGFGAQMTRWSPQFIRELTNRGYRVIVHDNRDVGLSHRFEDHGEPDMTAIYTALMSGQTPDVPYHLADMARDSVGLLEVLGVERAHVVGASMGGMIAQLVAANHPEKTASLVSIMSTTGNPAVPPAKPEAMAALTKPGVDPAVDMDKHVWSGLESHKVIGSPGYPTPDEILIERIRADARRAYYPVGRARQMAAVVACGDRRPLLAAITAPTVVIHGEADPLVPVEGGRDTAASIPGAELHTIPGMGHDLPHQLIPRIADLIERATARARESA